jgi:hypothetical protein
MAGYSGTPLVRKLGIKEGARVYALSAPDTYADLLEPLPDDVAIRRTLRAGAKADIVHIFAPDQRALVKVLDKAGEAIRPAGAIWVSWPKRASKVPTDLTEDVIRDIVLPRGLVDVKVAAIDETWSGLKVVWRVENR